MLNSLIFQFEMGEDRATGKIVGEYHDLVVDKLKAKNGGLKTDKLKSFALKKLIIPRNKDKSLPVSKQTGKWIISGIKDDISPITSCMRSWWGSNPAFRSGFCSRGEEEGPGIEGRSA